MKETKFILHDQYPDIILDKEQCDIVEEIHHNMMVIAGAGSGKTTTMVAKVKYLVEVHHINPKQILFLSFTKDTIQELQDQLWKQCNINVEIMTFHKLAYTIVKKVYYKLHVLTDIRSVIKKLVEEESRQNTKFKRSLTYIMHSYSLQTMDELITHITAFLERKRINQTNTHELQENSQLGRKNRIFLDIYHKIERKYERYLLSNNLIDFYNMIIEATELIKIGDICLYYQYIIVDEYQDISLERFQFIEAIRQQTKAYCIAVGDDWQSIYGFSGSQVSLFYLFTKLIPDVKIYYLSNTYRNSQSLIRIAGNFIMKDSIHLKKQLVSKKENKNPIRFIYYSSTNFHRKLVMVVHTLAQQSGSILILGRYQHEIQLLEKIKEFNIGEDGNIVDKYFPNVKIQFLTVHAAKGLGYDNVIILNMRNSKYGFPTKVKDNSIMCLLKNQYFAQEQEERRLFYVALTRTKNYVYLMVPRFHASRYIRELKKDSR